MPARPARTGSAAGAAAADPARREARMTWHTDYTTPGYQPPIPLDEHDDQEHDRD